MSFTCEGYSRHLYEVYPGPSACSCAENGRSYVELPCDARAHAMWIYWHTHDMVSHMKTTLNIDDTVMAQLKREAVRQRRTMSELVETALRSLFRSEKKPAHLPRLPTFRGGGTVVDIADRNALYEAMEGR
jgi:hypothetical protein